MPQNTRSLAPRLVPMAALCLLLVAGCSKRDASPPASGQAEAPAKDRRYAGLLAQPGGINLGVQPLSMPESSVSELMARDLVLAARLRSGKRQLNSFAFQNGKDVHHFLAEGGLQAGILGDMPALTAAAAGEVVMVAIVKQGFSSIVAGKPMLVKELKGKRVAAAIGSTAHFTLLNALENEGLSERDISLVGMEVGDMAKALAAGEIDAFSAWEPTPTLAFAGHPEFRLVHKGLSFGFFCLRRDFVAAHPEETRELVAAAARAFNWMRLPRTLDKLAQWTRDSAASFAGRPYPLPAAQMIDITRHDLLNVPGAPLIPGRLLREHELLWKEFAFLKKTGKIPSDTPWEKIRQSLDTGLLRGVLSEAARYGLEEFNYRGQNKEGAPK